MTYTQFVEGHDFNLSPDNQVPHQVRGRGGTWRPSGNVRILYSDVKDGRSFIGFERRRATDDCRAY